MQTRAGCAGSSVISRSSTGMHVSSRAATVQRCKQEAPAHDRRNFTLVDTYTLSTLAVLEGRHFPKPHEVVTCRSQVSQ